MDDDRYLIRDRDEYQLPNGQYIQMCVIHELWPTEIGRIASITTLAGLSVCREHLNPVADYLSMGRSVNSLLSLVVKGTFR